MEHEPYQLEDVRAPERFADALDRFAHQVEELLQAVEMRLRGALEVLADREAQWSREVQNRRFGQGRAEAVAALQQVRTWQRRLDGAIENYHRRVLPHAQRLLEEDTPRARTSLAEFLEVFYAYLRDQAPDSAPAVPGTASTGHFSRLEAATQRSGGLPVSGFDASPFHDDAAVEAYLAAWIPAAHRNPATLRGIRYDDRTEKSPGGGDVLGYTTPDPIGYATITILRHSESGAASRMELAATLAHEVAHHVHLYVLSPTHWSAWEKLHAESSAAEFVTPYAHSNAREDFAESYAYYIHYPDELERRSPRKHAFMRDAVFAGWDYSEIDAPRYSSFYDPNRT